MPIASLIDFIKYRLDKNVAKCTSPSSGEKMNYKGF